MTASPRDCVFSFRPAQRTHASGHPWPSLSATLYITKNNWARRLPPFPFVYCAEVGEIEERQREERDDRERAAALAALAKAARARGEVVGDRAEAARERRDAAATASAGRESVERGEGSQWIGQAAPRSGGPTWWSL